jgi:uncharacterized membrane-anchored protein
MTTRRHERFGRALVAGAFCLAVLGGMIVGHAWPLWTGEMVVMEASGSSPRDVFRGQYIALQVPASTLRVTTVGGPAAAILDIDGQPVEPVAEWWESWEEVRRATGSVVYVQLARDGELVVPATISRERIEGALNLQGRIRSARDTGVLRVEYGLDAYYVPEATSRVLGPALRTGRSVRLEVAIASSGRARIRGLTVDGVPLPR